jgi:hypothetical protein
MGFLKVNFPSKRAVLVNGNRSGKTNVVIEIQNGTHTISLAPPPDFKPNRITIILEPNGSGPLSPQEVTFEKI